jgi:hypothetical protein
MEKGRSILSEQSDPETGFKLFITEVSDAMPRPSQQPMAKCIAEYSFRNADAPSEYAVANARMPYMVFLFH